MIIWRNAGGIVCDGAKRLAKAGFLGCFRASCLVEAVRLFDAILFGGFDGCLGFGAVVGVHSCGAQNFFEWVHFVKYLGGGLKMWRLAPKREKILFQKGEKSPLLPMFHGLPFHLKFLILVTV